MDGQQLCEVRTKPGLSRVNHGVVSDTPPASERLVTMIRPIGWFGRELMCEREREGIAWAKADWRAGRFAPVPGDPEAIPLPQDS